MDCHGEQPGPGKERGTLREPTGGVQRVPTGGTGEIGLLGAHLPFATVLLSCRYEVR